MQTTSPVVGAPAASRRAGGRVAEYEAAASGRAFSMIEMIGVLAVIMILIMTVMPAMLRRIDKAAKDIEAVTLQQIGLGLKNHILNNRRVPARGTAFSDIATEMGWAVAQVATNARGNPRFYLVDPRLRIGSNSSSSLPYVQGIYGSSNITDEARVLIITSMGDPLPTIITNAGANSNVVFDAIWGAADYTMPTGWSWGGNWSDILVQRLSLRPLFVQVLLNNHSLNLGRFSIETTNTHVPLPGTNFAAWYLSRTVLGLHDENGGLQVKQVLQDVSATTNNTMNCLAPSFVYDKGVWRGRLFACKDGPTGTQLQTGLDLQAAYDLFMSGPPNMYHTSGAISKTNVTKTMYLFMSNYVRWAGTGFNSAQKAPVTAAQSAMSSEVGTYCNKKASIN